MARILIIGGHGKVALLLAPLLVGRGDDVTSIIRNRCPRGGRVGDRRCCGGG